MRFRWRVFVSFFLVVFGVMCLAVALVAACELRSYVMMLATVPGIAVSAAGLAILE